MATENISPLGYYFEISILLLGYYFKIVLLWGPGKLKFEFRDLISKALMNLAWISH